MHEPTADPVSPLAPDAAPSTVASPDLLQLIAENLDVVFYVSDPAAGRVLYVSPAFEALYGAPPGSLAAGQRRLLDFVHPLDRALVENCFERQAALGRTEIEYRIVRPDGAIRWVRDRGVVVRSERPLLVGVAEDITMERRREADRAFLADASALLSSLLEPDRVLRGLAHLAVPRMADWCRIHVVDDEGRVTSAETVHRDPEKLPLVRELERVFPPRPHTRIGIYEAIRTGEAQILEHFEGPIADELVQSPEHRRLLNELGIRSAMVVPLRSRSGVLGVITFASTDSGHVYDAGDLERAEELGARAALALENARLHRNARLARREADEARRVAEAANRAKSDFLAVMSHELRTPLNAVVGYADLLETGVAGPLEGKQPTYVGRIKESAGMLLALIEEILNLARIEAGRVELFIEQVEANRLVSEALTVVEPQVRAKGLELESRLPEQPLRFHSDPGKLRQILLNLLSNAVKFTDRGKVSIDLDIEADFAVFRVRDTGPGIPPEKRDEIFQPFIRLGARGRGTGLGLAVVRRYANLLGGGVSVEDGHGSGSVFVLRVPLVPEGGSLLG